MQSSDREKQLQEMQRPTQSSSDPLSRMAPNIQFRGNSNLMAVPASTHNAFGQYQTELGGSPERLHSQSAAPRFHGLSTEQHAAMQSRVLSQPATPQHSSFGSQPHTPTNSGISSQYSTPRHVSIISQGNTPSKNGSWPIIEDPPNPRGMKRRPSGFLLGNDIKRPRDYHSTVQFPGKSELQSWTGTNTYHGGDDPRNRFSKIAQGKVERHRIVDSGFSQYSYGRAHSQELEGGFQFGLSLGPPAKRSNHPNDYSLNTKLTSQPRVVTASGFQRSDGKGSMPYMPIVYPNLIDEDRQNGFHLKGIFSGSNPKASGQYHTPEQPPFNRAQTAAPEHRPVFRNDLSMSDRDAMFQPHSQASEGRGKALGSPFAPVRRQKCQQSAGTNVSNYRSTQGSIPSRGTAHTSMLQTPPRQYILDEDTIRPSQQRARAKSVASVDSDEESTPLDKVLRESLKQCRNNRPSGFGEASYRVADFLPKECLFEKERQNSDFLKEMSDQGQPKGFKPPSPREAIDLLTPETVRRPQKVVRSVPMKERITPARKQVDKKANAHPPKTPQAKATPKNIPKKQLVKKVEEDPGVIRQKQAADLLIRKEVDRERMIVDEALFGEADRESEQDKEKRIQEEAKKEEERYAAILLKLQKKEAAEAAELEKKKKLAEEEKLRKEEEAREVERRRVRREIERKRDEEAQQCALDERRIMAAEKIKADREKAEKEAAERERQKQLDAEKAAGVQAQAEELAKFKAKQEEAKRQAASLSVKRLAPSDKYVARKEISPDQDVDINEEEDEESLFVSEKAPKKKPDLSIQGSGSAAEQAKSAAQIALGQAREESEAQRAAAEVARKTKELMGARYSRKEIEKLQEPFVPRPEVVRERPTPARLAKNTLVTKQKQKTMSVATLEPSIEDEFSWSESSTPVPEEASYVEPQSTASTERENAERVPSQAANAGPEQTLRPAAVAFQEEVRLISQLRREQLEQDTKKKQAAAKKARIEKQKAERRKRDAEKAAEKKTQQIIADATKKGITLTDDNLKAQVEMFLADKEKEYQRRAEKRAQRETSQKSVESLAVKPPAQAIAKQQNALYGSNEHDEDEELTMEQLLRKKNEDARKERKMANAKERNRGFVNAAAKTTVDDLQNDSESDEDGFVEQINPETGKNSEARDAESESESESESDSDFEYNSFSSGRSITSDNNIQTRYFNATMSSSMGGHSCQPSSRIPKDILNRPPTANGLSRQALDTNVNIYRVMQERVKKGVSSGSFLVELYGNLEEANRRVLDEVKKFRKSHVAFEANHEVMKEGGLRWVQIVHSAQKNYATNIYVEIETRLSSTLDGYEPDWFRPRLSANIYQVVQHITKTVQDNTTNDETGQLPKNPYWSSKNIAAYTNLEMANHEACTTMCRLLKPKVPKIDWLESYEDAARTLRTSLETSNQNRDLFTADVDNADGSIPWLEFARVEVFVEKSSLQGPLN